MTARVVHESHDGGKVVVGEGCPKVGCPDDGALVVVTAVERAWGSVTLHLTRAESDELIDALIARNQEIDAAALIQDSRPSASPVAEGRVTAAGPSAPTGPGRPSTTVCARCSETPRPESPAVAWHEELAAWLCAWCPKELLANSTPAGGEDR